MIVDRYYYNQLNKPEKEVYKAFYKGILEHKDFIPVPVKNFSQEMFQRVYDAITDDNPLVYYINQSVISLASDAFGNTAICPQYFFTEEKIKEYNKKIQDTVNKLAYTLKLSEGTDLEKEKKVHDYICKNIKYEFEGTDKSQPVKVITSHNIIGVFAHHSAQCEGIAKAVKVLLNAVDVKCIVVSGKALSDEGHMCDHSWNIVNIGGEPTHLDVTWDIGSSSRGAISYDYFNLTDAQISVDHSVAGKVPICKSENSNYFKINKLVFNNKLMLKAYMDKGIKAGNKKFYFKVAGNIKPQIVINEMSEYGSQLLLKKGQQVRYSQAINEKMRTCRIIFR